MLTTRVETGTDFAARVPDAHYPTGTQVLVFCFDAMMAGKTCCVVL